MLIAVCAFLVLGFALFQQLRPSVAPQAIAIRVEHSDRRY